MDRQLQEGPDHPGEAEAVGEEEGHQHHQIHQVGVGVVAAAAVEEVVVLRLHPYH